METELKKQFISISYRHLLILIIGLSLAACGDQNQHKGHNNNATATSKDSSAHDHSKHDHGMLDIATLGENIIAPSIKATITEDSVSGWNLHLELTDFSFTPEKVGLTADANAANEGHAHLYIDGFKFSRIYSNWYHVKKLTPGYHKLEITLNANDHSPLGYKGEAISATLELHQKQ